MTAGRPHSGVNLDPTPKTITLNVTGVNNAPTGASHTVTTDEDVAYTFASAEFGFNDPSDVPPNDFWSVIVVTVPGAGTLTDNGATLSTGAEVLVSHIEANQFVFHPATKRQRQLLRFLYLQSPRRRRYPSAAGPDTDATARTMTVNVNPINDPPSLTGVPASATIPEAQAYTFDANATDVDLPAQTLTFSLVNGPTGASIDSTSGVFTWTPERVARTGHVQFQRPGQRRHGEHRPDGHLEREPK